MADEKPTRKAQTSAPQTDIIQEVTSPVVIMKPK